MAEVTVGTLYRVVVTEFERGWGQRVDPNDTKIFTTKEEAEAYKARWEDGNNPEYFFRAEITVV